MKRKLVALLLGCILMTPQVSFAMEGKQSDLLADIIIKAKAQIPVSADLTEFDYRETEEGYYLYWHDVEGSQRVEMECELDGDILSYYYNHNQPYSGIATVAYDKAQQIAASFLQKAASDYVGNLRLKEATYPNKRPYYIFEYEALHEGIKLFQQEVEVWVNKQTGEVIRFSGISYDENTKFDSSKPSLSLEEAEKAYLKEIGIDLKYFTYKDEMSKQQSYLAYQMSNYDYKGISAQTGKVIEGYIRTSDLYDMGAETTSVDSTALENGLSMEEQKEVETRKTFVAPDILKKKATAFFPLLANMEITSNIISQYNEGYKRQIRLEDQEGNSASLKVDAVTGEILSYSYSEKKGKITIAIKTENNTPGWTDEKAISFLEKINPEQFQSVILDTSYEGSKKNVQSYVFQRMANDIPVNGNQITLKYHTGLNQVTGYYKSWSDTTFKEPKRIKTQEEVIKNIGLELVYMQVAKNQYALVYNHQQGSMRLDAFSGEEVNYRGEVIEKEENIGPYIDIKGHPYEKIITSMYHSGIYLETNQFKPNEVITKKELFELISKMNGLNQGTIHNEAITDEKLSKEQGIYYLVDCSSYRKLAKNYELFYYPYQDEEVEETLKGYIAIAYGLGWLPKKEMLQPKEGLTKAEVMVYLYNMMLQNENETF